MCLPELTTEVLGINTEADVLALFSDFVAAFSREDLYRAAEEYARSRVPNSSVYTFRHLSDGLMGQTICLIVHNSVGAYDTGFGLLLDRKLMEYYGFTAESIPPRMLVREVIALRVRYNSVLADLERELGVAANTRDRAIIVASSQFLTPEDAYKMSDEEADRIIAKLKPATK